LKEFDILSNILFLFFIHFVIIFHFFLKKKLANQAYIVSKEYIYFWEVSWDLFRVSKKKKNHFLSFSQSFSN